MPPLLDALPFLSAQRRASDQHYPLDQLFTLGSGGSGTTHRTLAALTDPGGSKIAITPNQILTWISVGYRNKPRSDKPFPAIIDTGCNTALVISQWHLNNWARSAGYNPFHARIINLKQGTVASTQHGGTPQPIPKGFISQPLDALVKEWNQGHLRDWLGVIETDIWLAANKRGERDELKGPDPWHRLIVRGITVRHGATAALPLLGMAAFRDGTLVLPNNTKLRLGHLDVDLPGSCVNLTY